MSDYTNILIDATDVSFDSIVGGSDGFVEDYSTGYVVNWTLLEINGVSAWWIADTEGNERFRYSQGDAIATMAWFLVVNACDAENIPTFGDVLEAA